METQEEKPELDNQNMIRPKFESKYLEEEKKEAYGDSEVISLKINAEERKRLDVLKSYLLQPKDSTVYKQIAEIFYSEVILGEKSSKFREIILENSRRNKRTGLTEFETIKPDSLQK